MAGGIISTMQQVGGAFGVALVGILLGELPGEGQILAYTHAFTGALAYNVIALFVVAAILFTLVQAKS